MRGAKGASTPESPSASFSFAVAKDVDTVARARDAHVSIGAIEVQFYPNPVTDIPNTDNWGSSNNPSRNKFCCADLFHTNRSSISISIAI